MSDERLLCLPARVAVGAVASVDAAPLEAFVDSRPSNVHVQFTYLCEVVHRDSLSRMNDFLGGIFALAFLAGILAYVGPLVVDILGHIF